MRGHQGVRAVRGLTQTDDGIVYQEQEDAGGKGLLWLNVLGECRFLEPGPTEVCDVEHKLASPWST